MSTKNCLFGRFCRLFLFYNQPQLTVKPFGKEGESFLSPPFILATQGLSRHNSPFGGWMTICWPFLNDRLLKLELWFQGHFSSCCFQSFLFQLTRNKQIHSQNAQSTFFHGKFSNKVTVKCPPGAWLSPQVYYNHSVIKQLQIPF